MKLKNIDFSYSKTYLTEERLDNAIAKLVSDGNLPTFLPWFTVRRPSDARYTAVFILSTPEAQCHALDVVSAGFTVVG